MWSFVDLSFRSSLVDDFRLISWLNLVGYQVQHVCRIEDADNGETTWILNWYRSPYVEDSCDEFGFQSLNATDLTALLADTDSLARGAALAAEMGNTGPLKAFAVPACYSYSACR